MKYEETARRLRLILDNYNMRAQDLADKTGINKASISQYLNGTHKPSNITSKKIEEVTGVNYLWIMGFDEEKVAELNRSNEKKINFERNDRLLYYLNNLT